MSDKEVDGHVVQDGWLMHYSSKEGCLIPFMPVAEWEERKRVLAAIEAAGTLDERRRLLAEGQRAAAARREIWSKS